MEFFAFQPFGFCVLSSASSRRRVSSPRQGKMAKWSHFAYLASKIFVIAFTTHLFPTCSRFFHYSILLYACFVTNQRFLCVLGASGNSGRYQPSITSASLSGMQAGLPSIFRFTVVRLRDKKNVQNLQRVCYKNLTQSITYQGDFEHGPP